jgi:hypothetical protein
LIYGCTIQEREEEEEEEEKVERFLKYDAVVIQPKMEGFGLYLQCVLEGDAPNEKTKFEKKPRNDTA